MAPSPKFDLTLIGHIAQDYKIYQNTQTPQMGLGGGVIYGSLACKKFDPSAKIALYSKIGHDFKEFNQTFVNNLHLARSILVNKSAHTTQYQLTYEPQGRKVKLITKADSIFISEIPRILWNTKAIFLTPIANEINHQFLEGLEKQLEDIPLIGIDLQGILRRFSKKGEVSLEITSKKRQKWMNLFQKLGNNLIIKASIEEAQVFANQTDLTQATHQIGQTGAHILTTLGENGVLYQHPENPIVHIPAYQPKRVVDETGAGDCFLSLLLLELIQKKNKIQALSYATIIESINIAAAGASFLIEESGANGFHSRKQILNRVKGNIRIKANI